MLYDVNAVIGWFADWSRWAKFDGKAGGRDTHGQVELRPISCCGCPASVRSQMYILQPVNFTNTPCITI